MSKKNIVFLRGIGDDGKVGIHSIDKNGGYLRIFSGSANLEKFIKSDLFNNMILDLDTNNQQKIILGDVSAFFNQISDADTHKIALAKADNLYKSFSGKIPFFNPPSNIIKTTRDNIYQLLQGIDKLHVPKTIKLQPRSPSDIYDAIDKEDFKFPIIFRKAGDHGGISTVRVDNKTEQFHAFPLDGRDYYLTQFVDYAEDGIYAKYRLVVIDGEVFLRHAIFSDSWVIHSKSRKFMEKHKEYQTKEATLLKSFDKKIKPKIQPVINEINARLELDYFGIDCHIDDQFNITVFEINANMNVLENNDNEEKSSWDTKVKFIKNAIVKMIEKKL